MSAAIPASVANWMATHSSVERRIAAVLVILGGDRRLVDGAMGSR
jgi:hypothetical protein